MKKISLLLAFLFLFASGTNSQDINIKWSEKQYYHNTIDGFFQSFIGGNSKYIYAKFTSYTRTDNFHSLKLVCFDNKTMEKIESYPVMDFSHSGSPEYKGLRYHKAIVFENILYLFWRKESPKKDELFVQSFDSRLTPLKPLSKVYELNATGSSRARKPELFVMSNKAKVERILIGGELSAEIDESVKIEYKLMNNDLSFQEANQVILPVQLKGRSETLSSDYELGDDGNLHIKTYVKLSREEKRDMKRGESSGYQIYSVVDLSSGAIRSFPVKFEGKNIYGFNYLADGNSIKLIGFFCDLQKDPGGNDLHGIFYAIIDPKEFTLKEVNFSYFTSEQLDNLFSSDKQDRKDEKLFQSKKKSLSERESLASNYVIEAILSEQEDIVLLCSRMRNYSVTSCNGRGNCTTNYYCEKNNITGFRLNGKGKILWASNLDRKTTYPSWNVFDLNVVKEKENYIIIYGSDYYVNAQEKNRSSRKAEKYKEDNLEFAVLYGKTGAFLKKEYRVNALNTPKKDKKSVNSASVQVINNQLFLNAVEVSYKPSWLVFGICGSVACLIPPMIMMLSGSSREGKGYLGIIEPVRN